MRIILRCFRRFYRARSEVLEMTGPEDRSSMADFVRILLREDRAYPH